MPGAPRERSSRGANRGAVAPTTDVTYRATTPPAPVAGSVGSLSLRPAGGTGDGTAMHRIRTVALIAFPDVQILDVTGPLEVFARAARWLVEHGRRAEPVYR